MSGLHNYVIKAQVLEPKQVCLRPSSSRPVKPQSSNKPREGKIDGERERREEWNSSEGRGEEEM